MVYDGLQMLVLMHIVREDFCHCIDRLSCSQDPSKVIELLL